MVDGDAHIGQEHLVEVMAARHLDDRPHLDARRVHVEHEVGDAPVGRHVGICAGEQDPPPGHIGPGRPDLLTVDDIGVTVTLGPRAQRRQVRTGLGLAEQLAPGLGAVVDAGQPARLLVGRASGQQRGSNPTPPDLLGLVKRGHSCAVSVSRPSRIRPATSYVRGAVMACCVAT